MAAGPALKLQIRLAFMNFTSTSECTIRAAARRFRAAAPAIFLQIRTDKSIQFVTTQVFRLKVKG
jgi:hypothetical protein